MQTHNKRRTEDTVFDRLKIIAGGKGIYSEKQLF
jgi:hypothetical protein